MFKMILVFCVFAFSVISSTIAQRPSPSQDYPHMAYMDESKKYQLFWEATDVDITFEMIVETSGYIGIGWSPNGGMKGSDIITAWVDSTGKGYIQDRYAIGNLKPSVDSESNVLLMMAMESDGYTMIKFSRKLDTCDKEHDRPITTDTMRLIWSYGSTDPASPDDLYYHSSNRGVRVMYVLGVKGKSDEPPPASSMRSEFRVNDLNVPPRDTFYECRLMEMPKLDQKHHVIEFGSIITPGNEAIVHHMIVYACPPSENDQYAQLLAERNGTDPGGDRGRTTGASCGMLRGCFHAAFSWAVGGESIRYPEHVGYPIGGPDEPQYVKIEIHYDNPDMRSDIMDHSGMFITYTPELRKYDTGTMMVDKRVDRSHIIPPGQEAFVSRTYCGQNCLNKALDEAGLPLFNIIGIFPHTHIAGRGVTTRHIRAGKELKYLSRDDNYDFNYQMIKMKMEEVPIYRGDEIIVECTYETTDRKTAIAGGLGTREEMCISFVAYYPRIALSSCSSFRTQQSMQEIFTDYNTLPPSFDYSKITARNFYDYFEKNVSWAQAADRWQEIEYKDNYVQICSYAAKDNDFDYIPDQPAIDIQQPYMPPPSPCDITSVGSGFTITANLTLLISALMLLVLLTMN